MPDTLDGQAKSIIDRVIDLDSRARAEVLERVGDVELRRRVEALLTLMEKNDGFLGEPTVDMAASPGAAASVGKPGNRIGPYTLVEMIGEGGFGSVYLAEQSRPVRRQVALKIIKLGMDTRRVIARFDAERQALAMMDHPNIARVFDAGATDNGRPYFVMELVRGEPITVYCDRQRLSIQARLELFREICGAVQHAHQKGVIHRDLKPGNVLVAAVDGCPAPKVIDFGIAKATAGRLTDASLHTELHQLIGTPEYMSPEQADPSSTDIDTRSDIYSLGVILFELLTGDSPFDRQRLRSTPVAEVFRILREEEPLRPSIRLQMTNSTSSQGRFHTPVGRNGDSPSSMVEIAHRRRSEPQTLSRTLRGDLDWIVMKCLEKDRTRRYETASALADDVGRYLGNEPVRASPPSIPYKLRKFVRRNRGTVLTGILMSMTLLAATVLSIASARRERSALLAEERQRRSAEIALNRAVKAEADSKARTKELEQVAKFQQAQLEGIDPQNMGARIRDDLLDKSRAAAEQAGLTSSEIKERLATLEHSIAGADFTGLALKTLEDNFFLPALTAVEERFADQPLVKAQLLQTLSTTMGKLGLLELATAPNQEALEIRRRELGEVHYDTIHSTSEKCALLAAQGKFVEAEPYCRDSLERFRRLLGDNDFDTIVSISELADLLKNQGRLDEAEPYYREALARSREALGDDHLRTIVSTNNLGCFLEAVGRFSEAESYYREALDRGRHALGEENKDTIAILVNLGSTLRTQGRLDEAEPYLREALEKYRSLLGNDHPSTLVAIGNMGLLYRAQGKYSEAEAFYREVLEKRRRLLGNEHAATLLTLNNLGFLLLSEGRLEEAEPYTRDALNARRKLASDDSPDLIASVYQMGLLLMLQGKLSEAEPYCREALEKYRRVLGDEHRDTLVSITTMGTLLQAEGRATEAIALLLPVESTIRKSFTGANRVRLGRYLTALGRARAMEGQYDVAQETLSEAQEIFSNDNGATRRDQLEILKGMVELYDAWHAAESDKGYDGQAEGWRDQLGSQRASTQPAHP